jgi:hypothetical protein
MTGFRGKSDKNDRDLGKIEFARRSRKGLRKYNRCQAGKRNLGAVEGFKGNESANGKCLGEGFLE